MKKVISLILSILMFLSVSLGASASGIDNRSTNQNAKSKVSVNEYEMIKSLAKKSDPELNDLGYVKEDIDKIKNYQKEYAKHLEKLSKLEEKNLKELGYSPEKVEMLKAFDGSEEQITALAATLNLTLSSDYVTFSTSQNRTNARITYEFEWAGQPLFLFKDIVALAWNDWQIAGKYAYVNYVHVYGSEPDYIGYPTFQANKGPSSYGAGYKWSMSDDDNYFWAQSGTGIFTLYHNYELQDLSAYAEYGHSTLSIEPSFSATTPFDITFEGKVDTVDSTHLDKEVQ